MAMMERDHGSDVEPSLTVLRPDHHGYYRPSQREWSTMSEYERLLVAAKNLVNAVERENRPKEPIRSTAIREAIALIDYALKPRAEG